MLGKWRFDVQVTFQKYVGKVAAWCTSNIPEICWESGGFIYK